MNRFKFDHAWLVPTTSAMTFLPLSNCFVYILMKFHQTILFTLCSPFERWCLHFWLNSGRQKKDGPNRIMMILWRNCLPPHFLRLSFPIVTAYMWAAVFNYVAGNVPKSIAGQMSHSSCRRRSSWHALKYSIH